VTLLAAGAGFLLGVILGYLLAERRLGARLARAEAALAAEREKHRWTEEAKATLAEAFQALAAQNLEAAHRRLVEETQTLLSGLDRQLSGRLGSHQAELARLIQPVRESLDRLQSELARQEREREGAFQALAQHLKLLSAEQGELKAAATALKEALRSPSARGHWGELQLRRVVELAGMAPHVDFEIERNTSQGRPDLVVYLPGGGVIAVDAKAPMNAYLKALEAREPERTRLLAEHARALRARIRDLAGKAYWKAFAKSPELVVVFVPSEAALSAALAADGGLLEDALKHRVLPASPVTLLALLKSVAFGWREVRLGEEARRVAEEARSLVGRFATFTGHLSELGRRLSASVDAYNQAIGSYRRRLLPLAERLADRLGEPPPDPPDELGARPRD